MAKPLSKTQQELLDAMRAGVVVHYMSGINAYYFRADSMKSVTAAAFALSKKGYARTVGLGAHGKLELTEGQP